MFIGCVSAQQELNQPDEFYVETNPSGAQVLLSNEVIGITPVTIKLPREGHPVYLKIVKNGYKTEDLTLSATMEEFDMQKKAKTINSTLFFGGCGLVAGWASGAPLTGLLGGSLLGLTAAMLQEEKNTTTRWEYSPENASINLLPILNKE